MHKPIKFFSGLNNLHEKLCSIHNFGVVFMGKRTIILRIIRIVFKIIHQYLET